MWGSAMTILIFIAVLALAFDCVIVYLCIDLRATLHTRQLRGSARRTWHTVKDDE